MNGMSESDRCFFLSRTRICFMAFRGGRLVLAVWCFSRVRVQFRVEVEDSAARCDDETSLDAVLTRRVDTAAAVFVEQCPRGITRNKKTG